MKRPEGFDPSADDRGDPESTSGHEAGGRPSSRRGRRPAASSPSASSSDSTPTGPVVLPTGPVTSPGARLSSLAGGLTGTASRVASRVGATATGRLGRSDGGDAGPAGPSPSESSPSEPPRVEPPRIEPTGSAEEARRRAAESRRAARRASGERRRTERTEVRRFTRRSRHRRAAWITAGAVTVALVASVAVAVFSPLLSLEQIEVEGTTRVDAAEVQASVSGQLGTPLAMIDFGRITRELEQYPLIASYVTETAPPHTLVIRVTERQPIATVASGDGFDLVDPAGVVVQRLDERQEGVPLVDVAGTPLDGTAFRSAAEVLLALPDALRQTVDSVTASTADDVTLSLTSGERIVWGSADHSAEKAQVLAGLVADQARRDPSASVEFDVSAPDNGIIRTR